MDEKNTLYNNIHIMLVNENSLITIQMVGCFDKICYITTLFKQDIVS